MKMQMNNKVFLSFVFSYILVLLIPYSIGYFVYDDSVKRLSNKINEVDLVTLESRVEVIDFKIDEVRTSLLQLANDADLRTFVDYYDPFRSANAYFAMTKLMSGINSMVINNPSLQNITVYSNKYSRTMSSGSGSIFNQKAEFPYDILWGISEESFQTMLSQKEQSYFILQREHSDLKEIFLVMPIIISDVGNPEGLIIAQFQDFSQFMHISDNENDQSNFLIMDEYGNVLDRGNGKVHGMMTDEMLTYTQDLIQGENRSIVNEGLQISFLKSTINNWCYVSIIDMNSYLKDINEYKKSVLIFVVISAIVGLAIALYISRMKYKPIRKLKLMTSKFKDTVDNAAIDDFEMIETSIDKMLEAVDGYKLHILKQERKNTSWYFSRIIKGWHIDIDSDYDSEELKRYKQLIEKSKVRVLIYQIDDFTETFYESGMDLSQNTTWPLISFIIINVLEEFFANMGALHVLSLDNDNRYVIPVISEGISETMYAEKSKVIKEFLMIKFGIVGTIAISCVQVGEIGIKKGYDEALEVVEYKSIIGEQNSVATYEHLLNEKGNRKLMFKIEKEKIFVNYILAEDFISAKMAIYSIIDEEFTSVKSLQILKVKLFGMIDKMMYSLLNLQEKNALFGTIDMNQIDALMNAKNVPELKKNIDKIFFQLMNISDMVQDNQDRMQEILEYTQNNINDPDLNVSMIAEHFDMTISSLSKYMKRGLGVSPLDHIHLMRIARTKELLKFKNLTLNDISNQVGYYNYKTLVSRFKKYEGVTPTQYREKIQ